MKKTWIVVLAFVGVFVAGAVCGGPLIGRWMRPDGGRPRGPFWPQMQQKLEQELSLTEAQKARIGPIMKQAQTETQRLRRENVKAIEAVLEKLHAEVAAELTPEQKVKLDGLQKKFRERAERVRREFRDRPPGPPPEDGDMPPPPPPPDK